MNDGFKPPLATIPTVAPHKSFLNYIWIGAASVPVLEAFVIRDDDNTPEELKHAINEALETQARRGLILSMGFIN